MMQTEFDDADIEALRRLCADGDEGHKTLVRPRGGKRTPPASVVQLNVRVRPEISAKARQIATCSHCTITDVIERAIEELFARTEGG